MENHLSERELLALGDSESTPAETAAARSHLVHCFPCGRLYEGLQRESEVLQAAISLEAAPERNIRRELGWVVAAGLLASFGLVVFRRLFASFGEAASEAPLPDALPLLSNLGYRFLSLMDFQQIGTQLAHGGILLMTLVGIVLASTAAVRRRVGRAPLLLTAALVPGITALDSPAEALEIATGESANCRIAAGQVVDDDLLLLCEEAVIAGTVRGDVYFAGGILTLSGRVDGDVFAVGGELIVDGSVGLSLRGAAQSLRVAGEVGRGLAAAGERISVLPGGRVGGAVMIAGDRLSVAAPVGRSLLAAGRRLELDAPVSGDLKFGGNQLELGSQASVSGSARYYGSNEPQRSPGASAVEWVRPEPEEEEPWEAVLEVLIRWGMGLVLGLAVVLLASGPLAGMAAVGGRPLKPLLLGLLLFVGLPFAAVLLAITFVGLPLAFTTAALYLFLLYAARVVAAMVIGQAILGLASTTGQRIARIALGLGILALAVEIPVAGFVVSLLTMFLGLGAFGLWSWRSRPSAALAVRAA